MSDAITQFPLRRVLFSVFVLFVFCMSTFEIVLEFAAGETMEEMTDDLLRFLFSAVLLAILVSERLTQRQELADLRGQLSKARGRLAKLDSQSVGIASQYRAVMQKQFDAWRLSNSEQDVVIGMLKGLSFREIAELRGTREKTVRQQASTVYRKAGVGSRNELTAWFFEDMLEPPASKE
ncbi:MAG: LuxR C-terminal-related transcriptional regulator [Pseudomonadota bacterium]